MTEVMETTAERYAQIAQIAQRIYEQLCNEVEKLGFSKSEVELRSPDDACYRLDKDPASGKYSLVGDWINAKGFKYGGLVFHSDGSFYVEQDIAKPHPVKKQWFVEAVNAWGQGDSIKSEASLLPIPE
ncbi:MAG: hypothetical protein ACWA44_10945 [Thiotrichales bacterium]